MEMLLLFISTASESHDSVTRLIGVEPRTLFTLSNGGGVSLIAKLSRLLCWAYSRIWPDLLV